MPFDLSRRKFLKTAGIAAGATGLAAAGLPLHPNTAQAEAKEGDDLYEYILKIQS